MPKVGMKHFAYTKAGKKEAKEYAKKMGVDFGSKAHEIGEEVKLRMRLKKKQGQ